MRNLIITDAAGRPVERPDPPEADATIEEKIKWLRAESAYRDQVTCLANTAFELAFRKFLKIKGRAHPID